nr:helix-turn-helix domain-containing protein [Paenibacillus periandrae]
MNLNEIALSTGFEYDTYFIKQFTARKGMSPTTYRITSRKFGTAQ